MRCVVIAADPVPPAVYEEADPMTVIVARAAVAYDEADRLLRGDGGLFFSSGSTEEPLVG